jgi:hypothetical protein
MAQQDPNPAMRVATQQGALSQDQINALERMLYPPQVDNDTTDLKAGFLLGQQHVLKILRTSFCR